MKKVFTMIAVFLAITCLSGCDEKKQKKEAVITQAATKNETQKNEIREDVKMSAETLEALNGKEGVFAVLTTEKGQIVLELFFKETPMTVSN